MFFRTFAEWQIDTSAVMCWRFETKI